MLETSNHLAGQSMIIALYAICKLCFYFLTTEFLTKVLSWLKALSS